MRQYNFKMVNNSSKKILSYWSLCALFFTILACEHNDSLIQPADQTDSTNQPVSLDKVDEQPEATNGINQNVTSDGGNLTIFEEASSNVCSVDGEFVGYTEANDPDYGIRSFTFWAGKHNDAGVVTITNDDDNIYVNVDTNATADILELQVYVWTDSATLPSSRPAPGLAPYKAEGLNTDQYTLVIPYQITCGQSLRFAIHGKLGNDGGSDGDSDVSNAGETAYAGGPESPDCFDGQSGAWWGVTNYPVECFYNITGVVYEDLDQSFDNENEPTFEGIEVSLWNAAGELIATTLTDSNGAYLFEYLMGGVDYRITTGAPEGDYTATEGDPERQVINLSQDESGLDFGFFPNTTEPPEPPQPPEPPEPPQPPVETSCETAFAYDGTGAGNFLALDLNGDGRGDFNRWGWTIGPLASGDTVYDIYAGAGQSDISRGTLVGTLSLSYQDGAVSASYQLTDEFALTEVHFYVGETPVPMVRGRYTVAPGQYTVVEGLDDSASYQTQVEAEGDIYVIAHAVVCGAF